MPRRWSASRSSTGTGRPEGTAAHLQTQWEAEKSAIQARARSRRTRAGGLDIDRAQRLGTTPRPRSCSTGACRSWSAAPTGGAATGVAAGRPPHAQGGGRRGGHRESSASDAHPGQPADGGEVQKLLRMEERLHARVVARRGDLGGRQRDSARAGGLQDPNRPLGSFVFLGPPASEDGAGARARRVPLRRRAGDDPDRHVEYQENTPYRA